MLGVFRATCWPQQNIEPHAWAEEGNAAVAKHMEQYYERAWSRTHERHVLSRTKMDALTFRIDEDV